MDTANFISVKAKKPKDKILNMPLGETYLFTRGQKPVSLQELAGIQSRKRELEAKTVRLEALLSGRTRSDFTCPRAFFYCAVRLSAHRSHCPGQMEMTGTFDDLLCLARRIECTDAVELYFYELYMPELLDGFFGLLDEVYWRLTGTSAAGRISGADALMVRDQYWDAIVDIECAGMEETDWDMEPYDPDFTVNWVDDDCGEEPEQRAWAAFPEKECFCQCYLFLRDHGFEGNVLAELPQIVEAALDVFLAGTASLGDGGAFSCACSALRRWWRSSPGIPPP